MEKNEEFNNREKEHLLTKLDELMVDFKNNKKKYEKIAKNGCHLMRYSKWQVYMNI